jgi:hypothetical protein
MVDAYRQSSSNARGEGPGRVRHAGSLVGNATVYLCATPVVGRIRMDMNLLLSRAVELTPRFSWREVLCCNVAA